MNRRYMAVLAAGALLAGNVAAIASAELSTPPSTVGEVRSLAWDPDLERLWFAGDDADDGTLIGLTSDGEQSQITFGGAIRSVQALAIVDGILYIGDIGNPDLDRNSLRVIRMRDTEPGHKQYWAYDMRYPDGRQDARAMMVSPDGRMFFVTSGDEPGIYAAPVEPSRESTNALTWEADAPEGVTDAVFVDDDTVALCAEDGVHVLDATSWETLAVEAHGDEPCEALSVRDGELLVAGADEIRTIAVPNGEQTPESESPTPGGAETGEGDDPSEDAATGNTADEQDLGEVPRNTGTFIALAISGLIAIIAGATTYFVRT